MEVDALRFSRILILQGSVTRQCEKGGTWYVNKETNSTWTDYSGCGSLYFKKYESPPLTNASDLYEEMVPIIKTVTHFGYGISLSALILSVVIFASIK